ncbi:amidohydrolase family protein, partial [Sphingobium sp.]|uniref:amidohydrolase family protein n=1 Tax=Sphingobium sp. TaxID=1912891 RepID=UPI00391BBED2
MPDNLDEDLPIIPHRPPAADGGTATEAALDPDQPIIDPHHHFSSHWGGYFVKDLAADMKAGHAVTATVYIQCGHAYRTSGPEHLKPVGETEYVVAQCESLGQAAQGIAAGIVGFADLRLGAGVGEVLAAHIDAGRGRFKGIRHSGARHPAFKHGVLSRPPAGLYGDAEFRKGYAKLAEYGLSFDAWVYHPQIDEVVSLARAFP